MVEEHVWRVVAGPISFSCANFAASKLLWEECYCHYVYLVTAICTDIFSVTTTILKRGSTPPSP